MAALDPDTFKIEHWSAHPRVADIVLVPWRNSHATRLINEASGNLPHGHGDTCKACVLRSALPPATPGPYSECNITSCDGGLWLSRVDAAIARMES